jgi:hypothetical protein
MFQKERIHIAIAIASTMGHKHYVSRLREIITSFGRSYGPVVKHSMEWMKYENFSLVNNQSLLN